jgi:uncharacterized delta-60 repeat protein
LLAALGLALLVALSLAGPALAAPGDLDPSFDGDGKVITPDGQINDVAVQEDGKIVVAGNDDETLTLARYNPNGSLDTSFGSGGKVTTNFGHTGIAKAVALQPDGKIVVAGQLGEFGLDNRPDLPDFLIARYNPDGSLDTTFSGDGWAQTDFFGSGDAASDLVLQGNKILVSGVADAGSTNGGYNFALARYTASGNPDSTFDGDGKLTTDFGSGSDEARAVALQSDGKITVAGAVNNDFALARYAANGSLDTGFDSDGRLTTDFGGSEGALDLSVQEDGKLVVAGQAHNGANSDLALARYNPANGSLDGEFDFDGRLITDFGGNNDYAFGVAVQDDGRIVAAGISGSDFALARYNSDGTPNASFNNDGKLKTDFGSGDYAFGVAIQEDGKILAAGRASGSFALARYFGGNDDTPPSVSPPAQSLLTNSTMGASAVPVRLSWSATDSEGTVTDYNLQRSTDGGAYQNMNLSTATTKTVTHSLLPNHNYRYRVRATDDNGNKSFWKYGPRFAVDTHQESSTAIAYTDTWKQQSISGAYGGAVKYATASGATAKLTFTGRNVAWVAPRSSTRGKAEVWLDGKKVATVDLYSATALSRRVVYAANNLDPSVTHTLQVKVLGTAGRPRVDVDAFAVLR